VGILSLSNSDKDTKTQRGPFFQRLNIELDLKVYLGSCVQLYSYTDETMEEDGAKNKLTQLMKDSNFTKSPYTFVPLQARM